jgi:hypothetical protein
MASGTQLASARTQTEKTEAVDVDVGEPVRKGQFVVGMSLGFIRLNLGWKCLFMV